MTRLLFLLLALASPAAAQTLGQFNDPMQQQRCIWSCLAGSPGAGSYQYNQCVTRNCSSIAAPAARQVPTPPVIIEGWQSGIASDGTSQYASPLVQFEQGRAFYYVCSRAGESYLVVKGLEDRAAVMRLFIGSVYYDITFDTKRGDLTADVQSNSQFLTALSQGGQLRVSGPTAGSIDVPLNGAGGAIRYATTACFG